MIAPHFITGLPRSGTSLVTGIFGACGAWIGKIGPADKFNAKGTCENLPIRETVLKPCLSLMGFDPLGLETLPPVGSEPIVDPQVLRRRVENLMVAQGWSGSLPAVYKDAKLCLAYRQFKAAWPGARWIVVRRAKNRVIESCLRADPMTRRLGADWARWEQWHDDYTALVNQIENPIIIEPDDHIFGNIDRMKPVVVTLGLTWRPDAVRAWVSADLYHRTAEK